MIETTESISNVEIVTGIRENFNLPVIFVEDRDEEVNSQLMSSLNSDHYSPSVRVVYISKPVATSGFGFHLSRSKWDPYPYVSQLDKDSHAAASGLKEGDCVLEVKSSRIDIVRETETEKKLQGRREKVFAIPRLCMQRARI